MRSSQTEECIYIYINFPLNGKSLLCYFSASKRRENVLCLVQIFYLHLCTDEKTHFSVIDGHLQNRRHIYSKCNHKSCIT